jgi:hypothetical protein
MEIVTQNEKHVLAKYKNCKIFINLTDFLEINSKYNPNEFDDIPIIYIKEFKCDIISSQKGNGRILLRMVLEHIKNTYFKNEHVLVSLLAVSEERKDASGIVTRSDDAKLIQYYSKLGFRQINPLGIMIGSLTNILKQCDSYSGGRISRKVINKIKKVSR